MEMGDQIIYPGRGDGDATLRTNTWEERQKTSGASPGRARFSMDFGKDVSRQVQGADPLDDFMACISLYRVDFHFPLK